MILDGITLTNFGLYAGRQTIVLTPPSDDKPIVLFGGLNGGGKTTLLDAIQLCLFGPHAKTSSRGRLGYSEYLGRCIHDKAQEQAAGIQISFRHRVNAREERYNLRRSWRRTNGKCVEEFDVLKNERLAPALAENWANQVEDLLPSNIAHLFLFDGEQIEQYASPSDSASLIGTAIQNLLGLDVIEQLDKDIRVYERRKKAERLDDTAQAKVTAAETDLQALRLRTDALKQQRASLRTHEIDRRRRDLKAIEAEFRKVGGDLFAQRKEIERTLADAEERLRDSSEALRGFAAGCLPLVLIRDLLHAASVRDYEDQEIGRARQLHELLGIRDRGVLGRLRAHSVDADTYSQLDDYLREDRAEYMRKARQETALDLTEDARSAVSALLRGELDDVAQAADDRLKRHSEMEGRKEEARIVRESIPQPDVVADVVKQRGAVTEELARLEEEDGRMARDLEHLERKRERTEQSLVHLVEANLKNQERRDDRDRILHCASKVRKTLAVFRQSVIDRHVSRIEHLVLESYQQLLRKTSLVTRIAIDTERFALTLFGETGEVLRSEELSAGERQLLGIALLWGLAKAAGRPLPTAIDTPLGRLDTGHRRHFVDRYLPFASHQTLLFSTDEEIVGDYLERLGPWIGRTYYLNYDEETGQTRVVPGYFGTE